MQTTIAFVAGVVFSVAQFLLSRKMFSFWNRPALSVLYIAQLLILSLALLFGMFLISESALLTSAAGLVITQITLAVANSLKR